MSEQPAAGSVTTLNLAPLSSGGLRIVPLGGLGEIGMNCTVLEYEDEIIVVDCGLMFSDLDYLGVQFVIPDFTYLRERKEKVKAFLMTHGHEDHVGALVFALKSGIHAPVYASNFTSLLIRERLKEYGLDSSTELRTFKMGDRIDFKHFKVRTAPVNHSIVDSAAMIIDTPVGRIVHTGDFKIDPTPFYGSELDLGVFKKAGDEGVLLLLSDSTNVERHECNPSESVIYQAFERLFAQAKGLTIVSMFASNVGRMGQVFEIAKKLGRKVALSGRTMEQNVRLGAEAGYLKGVDGTLISLADLDEHPRDKVIVLSTGSQGEHRSSLIRVSQDEHPFIKLRQGDLVVMSSKFIPGNEKAIGRMINQLFKQGAEVLYESVHEIHVSGHATRPELKRMLEAVRPKFFVPIHGEYRHLVHHAGLARESGVRAENVLIAVNGDVLDLSKNSLKIADRIAEPRLLVEGRDGQEMTRLVLKDRRQMGEKGMVFALLVRNRESGRILSGPDIVARGLIAEAMEGWLLEEAKRIAKKVVANYEAELDQPSPQIDLAEEIRVGLRRFFNQNIGRKPVVLPVILDV